MIKLQEILRLCSTGGWLWKIPQNDQAEAEMIHDEWLLFEHMETKERHREIRIVREKIKEFIKDPENLEFAKKARIRYLKSAIKNSVRAFNLARDEFIDAKRKNMPTYRLERRGEAILKEIRGREREVAILEGKRMSDNSITDEEVERARNYPISDIFNDFGKNGRVKCPFHCGEDYNATLKNNYFYCFVCGKAADTIETYQKLNNCNFIETIKNLN